MPMAFAPPPRFITPMDPDAPSEGREIARLARALGKPLMPWQRTVVQGATELTEHGLYKYSKVLITVPRQSGKTTVLGPVKLHRIMTRPNSTAFSSAQTGKDADKRMRDLIQLTVGSPLAPLFKPRYAAGSMGLSLANGSRLSTFAGPENIHGETPILVDLDEIWAHDQAKGVDFAGAIGPAQSTLEGYAQWWNISTRGTANSGMLNEMLEQGYAGVPGLFLADWSAPDGADVYEPKVWWVFHPALGNTISEGVIAKEAGSMPRGEFIRAYANRQAEIIGDPIMAPDDWEAMHAVAMPVPSRRDIVVTYETHQGHSAVMATWRGDDETPRTRVLHAAPGDGWVIPFVRQIAEEWEPAAIAADDGGETRRITDELRRAGLEIQTTGAADFATACVGLLSLARDKTLEHDGSLTLARAIANLVLQHMGDSTRFSRKNSLGPVTSLIAAAVGLWIFDHREALPTTPDVRY